MALNELYFEDTLIQHVPSQDQDGEWVLVVRPERLFPVDPEQVDPEQTIVFHGEVKEFVYQGETAFAQVSINGGHDLTVRFGTDSSGSRHLMNPGDQLDFGLNRKDIILISK